MTPSGPADISKAEPEETLTPLTSAEKRVYWKKYEAWCQACDKQAMRGSALIVLILGALLMIAGLILAVGAFSFRLWGLLIPSGLALVGVSSVLANRRKEAWRRNNPFRFREQVRRVRPS
ncbi:hypothetical protein [Henriciella litoralis]|uniref:hypothetical protein n=1 Tax=Henriciella litoralis TaxID=568102 RepID=UPI000A030E23|nr:hypothetical protein [Henriciella litoralis]